MNNCHYCGFGELKVVFGGVFHKVDTGFGPFDMIRCQNCGSLMTKNPPSTDRLADFYSRYEEFRPEWYNTAAVYGAHSAQYRFYSEFLAKYLTGQHSWIDIGAGHGEIANILSSLAPSISGLAIDIGPRPPALKSKIKYEARDLNSSGWAQSLGCQFDCVFSVAVWEHVLNPAKFAQEALSLVAPGGLLILICPDFGSLASRLLRSSWPYFEPGEHISIPTKAGAQRCLSIAADKLAMRRVEITVKSLNVGYSFRYLLNVLRMGALASAVPPNLAFPLPTGILCVTVQRA